MKLLDAENLPAVITAASTAVVLLVTNLFQIWLQYQQSKRSNQHGQDIAQIKAQMADIATATGTHKALPDAPP